MTHQHTKAMLLAAASGVALIVAACTQSSEPPRDSGIHGSLEFGPAYASGKDCPDCVPFSVRDTVDVTREYWASWASTIVLGQDDVTYASKLMLEPWGHEPGAALVVIAVTPSALERLSALADDAWDGMLFMSAGSDHPILVKNRIAIRRSKGFFDVYLPDEGSVSEFEERVGPLYAWVVDDLPLWFKTLCFFRSIFVSEEDPFCPDPEARQRTIRSVHALGWSYGSTHAE